ncbi:zinc-binding dehydrogenase [Xylaria sp. FL0064]|nr:zinc-binding dehydrogenase [Xylaria sp. FL0064]
MEFRVNAADLPRVQRAIVQDENGRSTIRNDAKIPALLPGTIIVKTISVALNPSDYKMGLAFPHSGAFVGMDFAGVVVAVSDHDQERYNVGVGDIVCGALPGSNPGSPETGSFAQYIRAVAGLVLKVPDGIPVIESAAFGTPLITTCISIWQDLGITATPESPIRDDTPVLVYGGSTSSGLMTIQMLKLSGYNPITTCSPRNFDLVKLFGASEAFDYSSKDIGNIIRAKTEGRLRLALDCITDQASTTCCYAALGRPGGRYVSLEACPEEWKTRKAVKASFAFAMEAFGAEVKLGGEYWRAASAEKYERAVELFGMFRRLLYAGKLMNLPTEIVGNTFGDILDGLQLLKSGAVSGRRLIVTIPAQQVLCT